MEDRLFSSYINLSKVTSRVANLADEVYRLENESFHSDVEVNTDGNNESVAKPFSCEIAEGGELLTIHGATINVRLNDRSGANVKVPTYKKHDGDYVGLYECHVFVKSGVVTKAVIAKVGEEITIPAETYEICSFPIVKVYDKTANEEAGAEGEESEEVEKYRYLIEYQFAIGDAFVDASLSMKSEGNMMYYDVVPFIYNVSGQATYSPRQAVSIVSYGLMCRLEDGIKVAEGCEDFAQKSGIWVTQILPGVKYWLQYDYDINGKKKISAIAACKPLTEAIPLCYIDPQTMMVMQYTSGCATTKTDEGLQPLQCVETTSYEYDDEGNLVPVLVRKIYTPKGKTVRYDDGTYVESDIVEAVDNYVTLKEYGHDGKENTYWSLWSVDGVTYHITGNYEATEEELERERQFEEVALGSSGKALKAEEETPNVIEQSGSWISNIAHSLTHWERPSYLKVNRIITRRLEQTPEEIAQSVKNYRKQYQIHKNKPYKTLLLNVSYLADTSQDAGNGDVINITLITRALASVYAERPFTMHEMPLDGCTRQNILSKIQLASYNTQFLIVYFNLHGTDQKSFVQGLHCKDGTLTPKEIAEVMFGHNMFGCTMTVIDACYADKHNWMHEIRNIANAETDVEKAFHMCACATDDTSITMYYGSKDVRHIQGAIPAGYGGVFTSCLYLDGPHQERNIYKIYRSFLGGEVHEFAGTYYKKIERIKKLTYPNFFLWIEQQMRKRYGGLLNQAYTYCKGNPVLLKVPLSTYNPIEHERIPEWKKISQEDEQLYYDYVNDYFLNKVTIWEDFSRASFMRYEMKHTFEKYKEEHSKTK